MITVYIAISSTKRLLISDSLYTPETLVLFTVSNTHTLDEEILVFSNPKG